MHVLKGNRVIPILNGNEVYFSAYITWINDKEWIKTVHLRKLLLEKSIINYQQLKVLSFPQNT